MPCAYCNKKLYLGVDAIDAKKGVIGPRGFVPVDEQLLFCSDACICKYFDDPTNDEEERIP